MIHTEVDENLMIPEDWARAIGVTKMREVSLATDREDRGIVMLFRLFVKRVCIPPERTFERDLSPLRNG